MWRDQPWWLRDARRYGIVIVLLLAVVGAFIAVPDFNTEESAALGVLAIGQTFVIVCGLIDLSVGQLLGLIVVLSCDFAAGRAGPMLIAYIGC